MKLIEERILRDGRVLPGDVLKVDSFLNHMIDVPLISEAGREFYRLFSDCGVTKILTVEASGIGIACITATFFGCPVLFAKKTFGNNSDDEKLTQECKSYTKGKVYNLAVSKAYLTKNDRILIIDDFLAEGSALRALCGLCRQAGAEVIGAGVVIEKRYQGGGDALRAEGLRVESLAKIKSMTEKSIDFC